MRVTIDKRVPPGGGLGGGSSDAAATLAGLEELFALDLSDKVRHEVAAAVGSDVPFFLWPGPQLAMGRGQVLKDLVCPAAVVRHRAPRPRAQHADGVRVAGRGRAGDPQGVRAAGAVLSARAQAVRTPADVAALVHNDLQAGVTTRRPEVGELCSRGSSRPAPWRRP